MRTMATLVVLLDARVVAGLPIARVIEYSRTRGVNILGMYYAVSIAVMCTIHC